jgi:hypothetical protein
MQGSLPLQRLLYWAQAAEKRFEDDNRKFRRRLEPIDEVAV